MKFCVGDRVEFIDKFPQNGGKICAGSVGTVVVQSSGTEDTVGVEWDEKIGSHNLGGLCKNGHGWWVYPETIAPHSETQFEPASDAELMQLLFG